MHLILTGATGLVGSGVLDAMARNASITKITIFSRKPVPFATDNEAAKAKSNVITHSDFTNPPSSDVLSSLRDARGCVWALGISQSEVDGPTYEKITYDWPLAWARAFTDAGLGQDAQSSPLFNFVYVSGEGANTDPGRFAVRFAIVKGRTEKALLELGKERAAAGLRVYSARPGAVDPSSHSEILPYVSERKTKFRNMYERPLIAACRVVVPGMMSPTLQLGESLVQLAAGDGEPKKDENPKIGGEGRTLSVGYLRKMAGL